LVQKALHNLFDGGGIGGPAAQRGKRGTTAKLERQAVEQGNGSWLVSIKVGTQTQVTYRADWTAGRYLPAAHPL
jgi:hypothetical protein